MDAYLISVLTFIGIWIILAMSLNLLVGYAGQVSIGHAAFFGIGAYTVAVATVNLGLGFPLDILLAALVSGALGGVLGLPALRVRHDFLVLATIGINFIVVAVFQYTPALGGAYGIVGIPPVTIGGIEFLGLYMLLLVYAFVLAILALKALLLRTWFGVRLIAVREDEDAAAAIGISVASTKIWAFVLSCAGAGIAGALYARQLGSVFPENFGFVESVTVLTMVVLGGAGTLVGPIIGAIILGGLPEYLRFIQDWRYVIYGLMLTFLMIFERDGLMGPESRLRAWLGRGWRTLAADRGSGKP
ncbi:MAG: branched-chain amino acid ABC transporter permease [Alphaproteobacteria bacterium]|nr:branched-chain amino acid ABC transporter permease [Alphaproteobacteria bacterium]